MTKLQHTSTRLSNKVKKILKGTSLCFVSFFFFFFFFFLKNCWNSVVATCASSTVPIFYLFCFVLFLNKNVSVGKKKGGEGK